MSDPLTFNLSLEWSNYKRLFYRNCGNVGMARLFLNDGLLAGHKNVGISIFGINRFNLLSHDTKLIRVHQLYSNGSLLLKIDLEVAMSFRLNMAEYFRLRNICREIERLYGLINGDGTCLDNFIRSKKRRGGELRRKISNKLSETFVTNDPRKVPAAVTLWGREVAGMDRTLIELNYGLWGCNKLDTKFRQFLFNFVQGRLYLNNVRHRINDVRPQCTFCLIEAKIQLSDRGLTEANPEYNYLLNLQPTESVEHLFWTCTKVQPIIQKCFRWVMGFDWLRGDETIEKSEFLAGIAHPYVALVQADLIWKHYLKFLLYTYKLRHKIPLFPAIKYEIEGLFNLRNMALFRNAIDNIDTLYDR